MAEDKSIKYSRIDIRLANKDHFEKNIHIENCIDLSVLLMCSSSLHESNAMKITRIGRWTIEKRLENWFWCLTSLIMQTSHVFTVTRLWTGADKSSAELLGWCWHNKQDKFPYNFSTGQNDVQLVDIYKRQAADKLMTNSTHPEGQSRSSGPADLVKQTTGQILLFEA